MCVFSACVLGRLLVFSDGTLDQKCKVVLMHFEDGWRWKMQETLENLKPRPQKRAAGAWLFLSGVFLFYVFFLKGCRKMSEKNRGTRQEETQPTHKQSRQGKEGVLVGGREGISEGRGWLGGHRGVRLERLKLVLALENENKKKSQLEKDTHH